MVFGQKVVGFLLEYPNPYQSRVPYITWGPLSYVYWFRKLFNCSYIHHKANKYSINTPISAYQFLEGEKTVLLMVWNSQYFHWLDHHVCWLHPRFLSHESAFYWCSNHNSCRFNHGFAGETTIFPGETTNYHLLPVFNNKTTQSVANPGPGSSRKTAASCRISRNSSRHICHCCARSQADMVLFQLMTCENSWMIIVMCIIVCEGSLEVNFLTILTDGKAEVGRVREEKRREERRCRCAKR